MRKIFSSLSQIRMKKWSHCSFVTSKSGKWNFKKDGRVCLLDATYKTTKYDILFFFLVVKANVYYLVVGVFFVQVERACSIKEALEIFNMWSLAP